MGQDPKTQVIDLPFAGGLKQKTQNEWIDPTQGQTAITNGNFTYQGSISKRLGAKFVAINSLGAGNSPAISNPQKGLRAISWSQGSTAMAAIDNDGNGALFSARPQLNTTYRGIGPLPECQTVRRGLPTITTVARGTQFNPVIVDAPNANKTYSFYVEGTQTWGIVLDSAGELLGVPFVLYPQAALNIRAINIDAGGGQIIVMLQIDGFPNTIVGLTINNLDSPWDSITVDFAPVQIVAADITPYVDDPNGGFILVEQTTTNNIQMLYFTANWTPGGITGLGSVIGGNSMCTVSAVFGQGVGFLFREEFTVGINTITNLYFAAVSADHLFTVITPKILVFGPVTEITAAQPFNLMISGFIFLLGSFFAEWWNLQQPLGIGNPGVITPLGQTGTISIAGAYQRSGDLPLGMWPIGKPFLVGNIIYQPCVLQLRTLRGSADTTGSGASQSEQCTLYLLKISQYTSGVQPISTACVRQVDPLFSYQFLYYTTAALPQSQISGNRFLIGVRTIGEDVPTTGYNGGPSWIVQYSFDMNDQALLFQTNEISGDLRLSGSVPFICDGTQTFEDNFFNYPEFAQAIPGLSGTACVLNGVYEWAVIYVYTDASGQIARSVPVFTNQLTLVTGGPYPTVNFPPLCTSYRNILYAGSVNAEIYRTVANGGTFYLVGSTPAYAPLVTTFSVANVNATATGSGYHTTSTITVTIAGGGGATALPVLGGGSVILTLTQNGFGYTLGDNVSVNISGTGTGATAVATVGYLSAQVGYGIVSLVVTNGGSGYFGPVTVTLTGGSGTGAAATATATSIGIVSYTVTAPGAGYTTAPLVTITDTFGTGASAVAILTTGGVSAANLIYTDTTPDAVGDITLDTSTILYTTGGILDDAIPPTAALQCIHWQRLWIVDETLRNVWFSKQIVTGEAPGFNEAMTFAYEDGGDITALIGMDDKLVIFKLNSISVVYGQGPADNGQGSDLTQPQPIATDTGAIDWRSVVLFSGGLFFQSRTGLYVLDRSLQVSWVGKDVTDLLAQYPTVLSATLVPSATQVRFVCQNDGHYGFINSITITDPGSGYLPNDQLLITFTGTGFGAEATATIGYIPELGVFGVVAITILNPGVAYIGSVGVTITGGTGTGAAATATNETIQNTTIVIVYDYLMQSWTSHQYAQMGAPLAATTFATLDVLNQGFEIVPTGVHMLVGQDGSMWREQDPTIEIVTTPYEDQNLLAADFFVPTSITSAWVKLQGIQGYQRARRVMLLTEMPNAAGVSISVAVNYQPTIVQSFTWVDTLVAELTMPQFEMHLAGAYNKQQSVQITVADVGGTLATTGQGARFISAGIELQHIGDRWPQVATGGRA